LEPLGSRQWLKILSVFTTITGKNTRKNFILVGIHAGESANGGDAAMTYSEFTGPAARKITGKVSLDNREN